MEWTGRPLQPRRKPPKSGQKFATLQIYKSSKRLKPHPPDKLLPHTALMTVNKATLGFWLYHPCLLHYRFQQIPIKHPTTPTSNMLTSHKNHRDNRPTTLFQMKLKTPPPISLLYTSGSRDVVKRHNQSTTSKLE